jgi:hypothetical protein
MTSWPYSRKCRTASIRSGRAGGLAGELGPQELLSYQETLENDPSHRDQLCHSRSSAISRYAHVRVSIALLKKLPWPVWQLITTYQRDSIFFGPFLR